MNQKEKKTLRVMRTYILDNVRLRDVKDELITKEVYTPDAMEEIDTEKTDRDRMAKVLDTLEKRGPKAFKSFCQSLSLNNKWVKEALENTYQELCIIPEDSQGNHCQGEIVSEHHRQVGEKIQRINKNQCLKRPAPNEDLSFKRCKKKAYQKRD